MKEKLLELLKSEAVKHLLVKLIGTTVGFKAWIIEFILSYAFDQIAKPVILYAYRRGYRVIDTLDGKTKIKRLNNAKDKDAYRDALTDIFK